MIIKISGDYIYLDVLLARMFDLNIY